MNPFHRIAEEADRFYERTGRIPDYVIVGEMEWGQMSQEMAKYLDVPPRRIEGRVEVGTSVGMIEVRLRPDFYSLIAPVLERMP